MIFANNSSDKGSTSKIYKDLIQLNTKQTIQLKNGQRDPNRHFSQENIQISNRYIN